MICRPIFMILIRGRASLQGIHIPLGVVRRDRTRVSKSHAAAKDRALSVLKERCTVRSLDRVYERKKYLLTDPRRRPVLSR